ncbi:MAG: hypothetical protein A2W25_11800 [candidate division Zixibacteria bacterium RBG_16_53_22]|nr:MAG: hypothetical protein A2W25_11800 [candidate division Zixibacteria bacterium RBG_16_53_22]
MRAIFEVLRTYVERNEAEILLIQFDQGPDEADMLGLGFEREGEYWKITRQQAEKLIAGPDYDQAWKQEVERWKNM